MTSTDASKTLKRPRLEPETSKESAANQSLAIIVSEKQSSTNADQTMADAAKSALLPRNVELLSLTINPEYTQRLTAAGELGFERPATRRIPKPRFYELELVNIRTAMANTLNCYLFWKLHEQARLSPAEITAEVTAMTPIIVDACIAALYARMRVIHRQYGTYTTRFTSPPTYARDVELPLPFADAIQSIGVFEPQNVLTNFVYVPVYPEGIQNEGRATQQWSSVSYEAYVPILRDIGIPVKSVDTRIKYGTPWWTYKVEVFNNHFDLRCIFPPSNYSDHSAMLASMFILSNENGTATLPVIKHQTDDVDYPVRLRELTAGNQLNAFSALCHAHKSEWSQALLEI